MNPVDGARLLGGIDVSHWQGVISWLKVAAAGIEFAYIKATDGARIIDSRFHINWAKSKIAQVPRGAYHFFRPDQSVQEQVDNFFGTYPEEGDLPPALDLEVGPMDQVELNQARAFLEATQERAGVIPVLYADLATVQKITALSVPEREQRGSGFAQYPLWLADYSGGPSQNGWTFWQHTPQAKVSGVPALVDLDYFHGTLEQLLEIGKLPT